MTATDRQTMRWGEQPAGAPPGGRPGAGEERVDWQERLALRNWSLPVKLAAVLLVPTLFVVSLGVVRIVEQTQQATSYDGVQQAVSLEDGTSALLADLSAERTAAAVYVAAGRTGDLGPVQAAADASEASADRLRDAANSADSLDAPTRTAFGDAAGGLEQLDGLRGEVRDGEIDAAGVLGRYSEEINALLVFGRSLTREAADPSVAGLSGGLYSLSVVREQDAYVQAVIAAGIAGGRIDAPSIDEARNATLRRTIAVDDFRAAVGTENAPLADAVVGSDVDERDLLAQVVLGRGSAGLPLQVSGPEWERVSGAVTQRDAEASEQLRTDLQANAQALQDGARNAAGIASVVLLLALIAGAAVVFFVTRSLLRPLRLLRRTALDVAERRLPGAVRSLREGETPDTDVEATPIRTREEIGQVARAFDQVHEQAVRLAAEQAGLRSAFNAIFVNLSRRSQTLVERQLRLIEQLENNEEDPEALSNLFQLDHLATRMRRNSENLLVLSGTDLSRRGSRPVPVVDVLRAAASEVEQYQRVDVAPPPNVMLLGRTASDVVHLVAELLENATSFSAPDTRVDVVVTQATGGGLSIDIVDAGVGMGENDMRDANARLAAPPTIDVSASRRMGLFVVGRLATRHGIGVSLRPRDPAGIVARVLVPANAILASAPNGSRPDQRPPGGTPAAPSGAQGAGHGATNGVGHDPRTNGATAAAVAGAVTLGAGAASGAGEHVNGRAAPVGSAATSHADPATSYADPAPGSSTRSPSEDSDGPDDATTGRNGSVPSDGTLPRRGRRPGLLGGLSTRNSRRTPPPEHDGRSGVAGDDSDGEPDGAGADGGEPAGGEAGAAPVAGAVTPLPVRRPRQVPELEAQRRGSLAPVDEVPPPGAGGDGGAPAADEVDSGPATAAWSPADGAETGHVDGDDADEDDDRVAVSGPGDGAAGDAVTVWRAPGADEPSGGDAEETGRHQWRQPPPDGAPSVPGSAARQHAFAPGPQGFQGAPGPHRPQHPQGPHPFGPHAPGPYPQGRPGPHAPYPPPSGWVPPRGGPGPGWRGPVPPGPGQGPRPPWAAGPGPQGPAEPASGLGDGADGGTGDDAAVDVPASGSDVPVSGSDVPVSGSDVPVSGSDVPVSGSDVPVSGSDVAATEIGTAPETGTAPGAGIDPENGDAGEATTARTPGGAAGRTRRALPMTVRRSVPLRPREDAEPAPAGATDDSPVDATTAPEAPTAAGSGAVESGAVESGAGEPAPRSLGRRRGPAGSPPVAPGSAARLRSRRPEGGESAGEDERAQESPAEQGADSQALFSATQAPTDPPASPGPAVAENGAALPRRAGAPARPAAPRPPLRAGTAGRERTPIFDEVASVWFRETTPGDGAADEWETTGDAGWRAAAASTEASDGGTTEAGLPRRRPRARLVPGAAGQSGSSGTNGSGTNGSGANGSGTNGSGTNGHGAGGSGVNGHGGDGSGTNGQGARPPGAGSEDPGPAVAPVPGTARRRSADAVRGRLASYQRGVSEGRGGRGRPSQDGDGERPGDEEDQ